MPPAWSRGIGSSPPLSEDADRHPADLGNGGHGAGTGKRKAALHAMKAVSETPHGVKKQKAAADSKAKPSTPEAAAEPAPALNGRQRAASGSKTGTDAPVRVEGRQMSDPLPEPEPASTAGKTVLVAPVKHSEGAAAAAAVAHLEAPATAAATGAVDSMEVAASRDALIGDVTPAAITASLHLPAAEESAIFTDGIAPGCSKRRTPAELREDAVDRARERAKAAAVEEAVALAAEQVRCRSRGI